MKSILLSIRLTQYCGFWRPKGNSLFHEALYNCYFCAVATLSIGMFISKFISISKAEMRSLSDFCTETFLLPEGLSAFCLKGILVYLRQSRIKGLLAVFELDFCKPKNESETEIIAEYEKQCR